MASNFPNEKELITLLNSIRKSALIVLFIHCYFFCYAYFECYKLTTSGTDEILVRLYSTGLFNSPFITKFICLFLLIASGLGERGKKSATLKLKGAVSRITLGLVSYLGSVFILSYYFLPLNYVATIYILVSFLGFVVMQAGIIQLSRLIHFKLSDDIFNEENETFPQEEELKENEYSVNLPTSYRLKNKRRKGWINIVNPFRGTIVLGTPGSGKSYAIVNSFIRQHLQKGFSMYVYDFKYPDLSNIVYNTLLKNADKFKVKPKFYIINFDDLNQTHRCNPLDPTHMSDITDATESAKTILLNLNRNWIQKQGDFFVESPINFFTSIIWFLRIYKNGKYCTLPHAIQFISEDYNKIFPILASYYEIAVLIKPFISAFQSGAVDQLEGQIASARIPLSKLASPQLYYVLSGNDFTLDINNPESPKILCLGNNPDRQDIYGAALGLFNSRIVKIINKKNKLKCSLIIDELPTIYFRGLDNLIATARSNKVSVCLSFQDLSQLIRDYGDKVANSIFNLCGNLFSGQVLGETAEKLSKRFGKIVQRRESMTVNSNDTSFGESNFLEDRIPQSKISALSQGEFVGSVADNVDEKINLKVFNCKIELDSNKIKKEESQYSPIPYIRKISEKEIRANFERIKSDIELIISEEFDRICNDPQLHHLLKENEKNKSIV